MGQLVEGYDVLRVRIDRRADRSYRAFVSTWAGEGSVSFELPFETFEVETFVGDIRRGGSSLAIRSSAVEDAKRFGGELFKALFHGRARDLYTDAMAHARGRDCGLRITLCLSDAPELIAIPWEFLFDDPDFLAMSAFTPIVRYLDLPRGHRSLRGELPLRILAVVSDPADYERLDVELERDNLERALAGLTGSRAVELHWLQSPTPAGLLKTLRTQPFHVLHYIGHGEYDREAESGVLLLEDDGGWAEPVTGDRLGMILHDFTSLRLAVLNTCGRVRGAAVGLERTDDPFVGVAGSLVQRDIPAVVAMQFEITDQAAISFASGFYAALAAGSPVDASVAASRLSMLAQRGDDIEWGTPVLFMRVPDGRIFDAPTDAELGREAERERKEEARQRAEGRRADARSDLAVACQMIVAAIAAACTSISVNDVAASVCSCRDDGGFDEVARFYLPYQRPPSPVRWHKGKGVAGWAWAIGKDLFCDLRPLIARLDAEGPAAFDALLAYERFGMSADELDRTRNYTGIGAIQLVSSDDGATLVGMLIIDYVGSEGFDCIARHLARFPVSAYVGGCASVMTAFGGQP